MYTVAVADTTNDNLTSVTNMLNVPNISIDKDEIDKIRKKTEYISQYNKNIDHLHPLNKEIFKIREDNTLSNDEKITKIGQLIYEKGNITYCMGSNIFNWDGSLLDEDFETVGCYYKDGLSMDCSTFAQYLICISTGNSEHDGILLSRVSYLQSIEGNHVEKEDMTPGTLCLHFNGGLGVKRTGEELKKNESPTSESNHVAIYLGNGKYIDCSDSYNGVRITDTINDRPGFDNYFTWYRDVLSDPNYKSDLEIQWQEMLYK